MIRLHDVHKRFAEPVLSGVTLDIPEGCLFALMGPGAAGKSVLIKLVAGLLSPNHGSVEVLGQDLAGLSELELTRVRQRIGMQFQNNALFDFMTVEENIAFPLRRFSGLDDAVITERVATALERVGLAGFQSRMPSGLSGGQKRRVGLARATITDAPIALFDEPAAGLDPVTSQRIFDLLRSEQQRAESTVIMVSSDVERLLSVADRVALMVKGRILFQGTTEEARSSDDPAMRQFLRGLEEGPL